MAKSISVNKALGLKEGADPFEDEEALAVLYDSVQPACCEDRCDVEPDGHCPHDHPSVSLKLGVI